MKVDKKILTILVVSVIGLAIVSSGFNLTVLSVSRLNIDPQGYEDSTTHEWTGSFWSVLMVTDFTDQIAGFHLAPNNGEPSETYAETLDGKVYAETYTVDGKQLVPTADVMVHITPQQPYYERPLEIQQGFYAKKTYATGATVLSSKYQKTGTYTEEMPFIHYAFGSGSWTLHTPFKVDVYKDGVLSGTQTIDTVGGTGIYRIPASGEEFINIIDLGKINTGYGEPQWDDVLYFSENHIYVRSAFADNLLKYDAGETGSGVTFYEVSSDSFNKYWFGPMRWDSDGTPAGVKNEILYPLIENGDYPGWFRADTLGEWVVKPKQADVFANVIPYLQNKGVQKVSMPTGFDHLEKTDNDNLRVYMNYGAYSSLITIKISTELADTIVWQPQVARFEITSFPDFGDVLDSKSQSITVKCMEGSGSAQIAFTKNPSTLPMSITPTVGTPILTEGESYTASFDVLNLGTPTDVSFTVTASVSNSIGSVTDTDTASGVLKTKTGASTIVHVVTEYENKPISNLPVTIFYSDTSQTKTTGVDGLGVATFNLGTTSTVTVKVEFAGNGYYLPASKTVSVTGGTEKTITLALSIEPDVPVEFDWGWILAGIAISMTFIVFFVLWRKR